MAVVLVVPEPKEKFMSYGPPLGLCYLSSYLKRKGIQDVRGVDLNIDTPDNLKKAFNNNADIVGIYCATKTLNESMKIAKIAKDYGSTVVIGGPHPSLCPEDILQNNNVDFIVIGEGEISFFELVDAIYHKYPYENINGIGYKNRQGKIVIRPKDNLITDLDSLPFPDRSIFNIDKYPSRALTVTATRGCPYSCTNCQPALNILCGKFKFRSVDNVLKEIEEDVIGKYNCRLVHFVDNDLTVSRKWMRQFCIKIIEQNLKFEWGCQGRVNTLDKELMILMKKAGCRSVSIGIESGSERVVNQILCKKISLDRAKKVIKWANEIKLGIHIWFMIGIPLETKEEMIKTIDFASSLNVSGIGFSIGTPWPITGFYKICKERGWLLTDNWGEYNEKRYCRIKTDDFVPEDVEECRQKIFSIFLEKRWRVDKDNFIVYNPYYDNSCIGVVKSVLKRLLFPIFGEDRVVDIYHKLKFWYRW